MSNVFRTWDFYQRLGEIIGNLPMSQVTEYAITGDVNGLPKLTINQYITDAEDNLVLNADRSSIESKETVYMIIEEDEYNKLMGNV